MLSLPHIEKIQTGTQLKMKIKKRILWIVLSILVGLWLVLFQGCVILPIPHQRTYAYGIEGRVVDEAGTPIPNTKVVTEEQRFGRKHDTIREAVTDSNGRLKVKPLKKWHGAYCFALWNLHDGRPVAESIFPYRYSPSVSRIEIYVSEAPELKSRTDYSFGRWIDPQSLYKQEVARLQGDYLVFNKIVLRKTGK